MIRSKQEYYSGEYKPVCHKCRKTIQENDTFYTCILCELKSNPNLIFIKDLDNIKFIGIEYSESNKWVCVCARCIDK